MQSSEVFILDRIGNNGFVEPQNAQDAEQRAPVIFMLAKEGYDLVKKKQRSSEKIKVKSITFIREQDGVPEQKLKSALVILFQNSKSVISAYLVRVDYGNPKDINVALCIRSEKFEDFKLRKKAAQIFSERFGSHEHLDIIFLRDDQEKDVKKVSKAFYGR